MTGEPLSPSSVEESLDRQLDEWLSVLGDLISIPSENPPGDTRDIAEYLTEFFDERGVPFEVIAPKDEMPNVVAHFEGRANNNTEGRHLTFNGHLDTFPRREEDRWERDPFAGTIEDGKIHGRGASDMYGGLTASLAAFIYLFENRENFNGQVTLAAVSDEETGGKWGTKYLVENHPEYTGDAVVSGEPSSNGIIRFGERGRAWTEITVRGESAHTCSVPRGVNAVEELMKLLEDIQTIPQIEEMRNVPERERQVILDARTEMDAAYGEGATDRILVPRVNVGIVEGGEKVNLVAENAKAEIDIRLPIGTSTADALAVVREFATEYPIEIEINAFSRKDPSYSDYQHPIFQHLQTSADKIREDGKPAFSCALAGTDCAFYREQGVPCAVYGPTPHNLGSQNEYITVNDFKEILKTQAMATAAYLRDINWEEYQP